MLALGNAPREARDDESLLLLSLGRRRRRMRCTTVRPSTLKYPRLPPLRARAVRQYRVLGMCTAAAKTCAFLVALLPWWKGVKPTSTLSPSCISNSSLVVEPSDDVRSSNSVDVMNVSPNTPGSVSYSRSGKPAPWLRVRTGGGGFSLCFTAVTAG